MKLEIQPLAGGVEGAVQRVEAVDVNVDLNLTGVEPKPLVQHGSDDGGSLLPATRTR
jgi:hypothetical protein